ncbi:MAG: hypothetical protein AB8B60_19985 [Sulfitobacter sp.]
MAVQIAFILWFILIVGLKVALLAYDPHYRKAYGKWQSPMEPFKLILAFPLYEISWWAASIASFAGMIWWLAG